MNYILKTACVQSQNVSLRNYYYVNEDGVRLTNQWVSFENEDDEMVDGKDVSVLWYYLGEENEG